LTRNLANPVILIAILFIGCIAGVAAIKLYVSDQEYQQCPNFGNNASWAKRFNRHPPTSPPPWENSIPTGQAVVLCVKVLGRGIANPQDKTEKINTFAVVVRNPDPKNYAPTHLPIYANSHGQPNGRPELLGVKFGGILPETSTWAWDIPPDTSLTLLFAVPDDGEDQYCVRGTGKDQQKCS